jgi:hypothetical protein
MLDRLTTFRQRGKLQQNPNDNLLTLCIQRARSRRRS